MIRGQLWLVRQAADSEQSKIWPTKCRWHTSGVLFLHAHGDVIPSNVALGDAALRSTRFAHEASGLQV